MSLAKNRILKIRPSKGGVYSRKERFGVAIIWAIFLPESGNCAYNLWQKSVEHISFAKVRLHALTHGFVLPLFWFLYCLFISIF